MQSIAGIINPLGKSVENDLLSSIFTRSPFASRLKRQIWHSNSVAFAVDGSKSEALLVSDEYIVAADARLDNREQLGAAIGVSRTSKSQTDCRLICEAYKRWGPDCVERLLGDWWFAVWDKRKRCLFLARDQYGYSSLYYAVINGSLHFSSSLNYFLSLPGYSFQPNDEYIAALLTVFAPQETATLYKQIHRIPPAHYLISNARTIRLNRYYHIANAPELRFNKDEDYVEAFQEIFKEAVRCRLNGQRPVGVTLSGGLDSGSVAATAAQLLKGEQQPVQAFSHVPLYNTSKTINENQRFGDESPYVEAVAAKAGNIQITWIKNTLINPIAGQAHILNCFPEPIIGAVNSFWLYQLLQKAKEKQTGVLFLGQLGNATISYNGDGFLANLAKTWQIVRLYRKIKALSKAQANSFWRVFAGNVCVPLAPHLLYRLYCAFRHNRRHSFLSYSAINPAFARKIELEKIMQRRGHDPLFQPCSDTRKMRLRIINPGVNIAGSFWHAMSEFFQLPILDPTADKRVIEYCLSIPDDQYLKNGMNRSLVRRAFKGTLPDAVLLNRRRGLQAADITYRLRASAKELSALINTMERDELVCKYVDVAKLRNCVQSLSGPLRPELTYTCGSVLMRGLMVGQCLQRFFK